MIIEGGFSHKIEKFYKFWGILNPKGQQNKIIGSKVSAILLNGLMWPIGGVHREGSASAACAAGLLMNKD